MAGLFPGLLGGSFSDNPDTDQAAKMAAMATFLSMLAGRGRNAGEIAGQAGMNGLGMFSGAIAQQEALRQQKEDRALRERQIAGQEELRQAQLEQSRYELDAKRRAEQRRQAGIDWLRRQAQATGAVPGAVPQRPASVDPAEVEAAARARIASDPSVLNPQTWNKPQDYSVAETTGVPPPLSFSSPTTPERGPMPFQPTPEPARYVMTERRSAPERVPNFDAPAPTARKPEVPTQGADIPEHMEYARMVRERAMQRYEYHLARDEPEEAYKALLEARSAPTLEDNKAVILPSGRILRAPPKPSDKTPTLPADWNLFAQQEVAAGRTPMLDAYTAWKKEIEAARAPQTHIHPDNLGLKPKDKFEMEGKLRDDFDKQSKVYSEIKAARDRFQAAFDAKGGVRDMGAVYGFAKILDPTSVVRESEYAAVLNTQGLVDRLKAYITKAANGEFLTDRQRQEMATVIDGIYKRAADDQIKRRRGFGETAKRYNLDPENILGKTKQRFQYQMPDGKVMSFPSRDALLNFMFEAGLGPDPATLQEVER